MKFILGLSLLASLTGCASADLNPDRMCIMFEKRFVNGVGYEIYNQENRCK